MLYLVVFGWGLTAALPALFVVIVGASMAVAHITRDHLVAVYAEIVCIILITVLIQWSIGGVFDSGFVMVWALVGPLASLMFRSRRESAVWFGVFAAVLALTVGLDDVLSDRALEVSPTTSIVFFAMNLGVMSFVVFVFARHFVSAALHERARANRLLLNVLPTQIAEELKQRDGTIAREHGSVSVLFADIVGSTPLFADLEPTEVVDWLNELFSTLDEVVDRHGLEKLRTMGDNYMVGAGVPEPRSDHATALVRCALEMVDAVASVPARNGRRIELRFGINSGPVVAGVIGRSKFHYDMWGDAVNIAARMESHGASGRIHVSSDTYELIRDAFVCEPRGTIPIKGKGEMQTWFVVGESPVGGATSSSDV